MKKIKHFLVIAFCVIVFTPHSANAQEKLQVRWQKRANLVSADSLLTLFSQMSPFEVFDHISYLRVDCYDSFHNMELRQHLVKWLDKELYFQYSIKYAVNSALSNEEYLKNDIKYWLREHNKRELIDTVLNTPSLYNQYTDTVINYFIQYHRQDFYQHGASLPSGILSFFSRYRVPEAYEIIYSYWEDDGKIRKSAYYPTLLAMHDPEALQVAKNHIDSLIASGDAGQITNAFRWYGSFMYGEHAVDWRNYLLNVTVERSLYDLDDASNIMVPFNIYLISPFNNRYFLLSENEVVKSIINSLFEPFDRIEFLSRKEIISISKKIIDNIHEFEKAAQLYREWLIEDNRYWKEQMPYNLQD
jgi:hypothetical protein